MPLPSARCPKAARAGDCAARPRARRRSHPRAQRYAAESPGIGILAREPNPHSARKRARLRFALQGRALPRLRSHARYIALRAVPMLHAAAAAIVAMPAPMPTAVHFTNATHVRTRPPCPPVCPRRAWGTTGGSRASSAADRATAAAPRHRALSKYAATEPHRDRREQGACEDRPDRRRCQSSSISIRLRNRASRRANCSRPRRKRLATVQAECSKPRRSAARSTARFVQHEDDAHVVSSSSRIRSVARARGAVQSPLLGRESTYSSKSRGSHGAAPASAGP